MKSDALKVAWFIMWNTAATSASRVFMPSNSVIRPRWLIVEYASTPFMSFWKVAEMAPSSNDAAPADETAQNQSSVPARAGHSRASRKTPAFTIAAECK